MAFKNRYNIELVILVSVSKNMTLEDVITPIKILYKTLAPKHRLISARIGNVTEADQIRSK